MATENFTTKPITLVVSSDATPLVENSSVLLIYKPLSMLL